jgi:hypothetical protein
MAEIDERIREHLAAQNAAAAEPMVAPAGAGDDRDLDDRDLDHQPITLAE